MKVDFLLFWGFILFCDASWMDRVTYFNPFLSQRQTILHPKGTDKYLTAQPSREGEFCTFKNPHGQKAFRELKVTSLLMSKTPSWIFSYISFAVLMNA